MLFTDQTDDLAKEEPAIFQRDLEPKQASGLAQEGDKEIHQIFEDLDKKLALNSGFTSQRATFKDGQLKWW